MVAVPLVTARMTRDGPGGAIAVQLPSRAVVTVVSGVNAFVWLSGAARRLTGCPASGAPWLVV